MYLLIDNYDSFTYNLYQAFAEQGVDLLVRRNDRISLGEIEKLAPEKIIISPGPKTPESAGISVEVIRSFSSLKPILGVCLGLQCIVQACGGRIDRVKKIVHGKTSLIEHDRKGIFKGVPSPFRGARYHSLHAERIPDCLRVTARTQDDIVMGVEHLELPLVGLQFHPESFLTEEGSVIVKNFIEL
ncbi:MAG: anthranilate/aminodeoxychorismate synthase component II [Candidatus Omnitrophica bacterium]|nr:anthranilate/aminodeoxychorismate synthase component II [Candidatus Omnitrophota bacterium]